MIDRTSKFLLTVIALLLFALLVRPALTPPPAQAQANPVPVPAPAQMAVADNTVYLLQNGKLSVYILETKASKQLMAKYGHEMGVSGLFDGPVTIRQVATQDVTKP